MNTSTDTVHPDRTRLRLRRARTFRPVHRHLHQPVRRHRRGAPARRDRRRRPAAAAGPRLARDLVRLASGDAGAGPGLPGHRRRPARHRPVRQAAGRLRHRHPRQRPRRADGRLGHERFAVVGHDTGFAISYALAADHPDRVERLALAEIPGPRRRPRSPPRSCPARSTTGSGTSRSTGSRSCPSSSSQGREDVYFGYEFAIQGGELPDDVDRLLRRSPASDPDALRGSLGFYRAFDATLAQNDERASGRCDAGPGDRRCGELRRSRRARRWRPSPTTCRAWSSPAPATGSPSRRRTSCWTH